MQLRFLLSGAETSSREGAGCVMCRTWCKHKDGAPCSEILGEFQDDSSTVLLSKGTCDDGEGDFRVKAELGQGAPSVQLEMDRFICASETEKRKAELGD